MENKSRAGFSLVEIIITLFVLTVLSISILGMFQFALRVIAENKARTGAIIVGDEAMETVRNLPYSDVGTVGGLVPGSIPQQDTVFLNNIEYTVNTSITYIDDPFDGTVALGTDQLGNDYKKVRIEVSWIGQLGRREIIAISNIAPKGIETNEGQGILWINVIDANGAPVPAASIHILNNQTDPPIDDSSQSTNNDGYFYSSVPASNSSYQIIITKGGYSSDYNCAIDPGGSGCSTTEGNPDPTKPLATVLEGYLTETTFAIDKVATININTASQNSIPTEWQVNTDTETAEQRNPAVALGPSGQYYFSWQDFRNSAARIYGQNYTGQTNQWSPDLAITTSNNQNGPDLSVDDQGYIYVVWHDDRNGQQDIYFDKYDSSGADLLGGEKKVNSDTTAADQLYPKIVTSASTTAAIEFVAWRDTRAGDGNSDIYLQKFDGSGTAIWSNEIKVNFTSSSQFQASDSTTWEFDNPSNYVCDDGNCDGDTSVRVTGGFAELVPIQSCQGTPNACATLLTQSSCINQGGCSWDPAGPCSGASCNCTGITQESDCIAADSCSWESGIEGCTGTSCNCWDITGKSRCQSVSGCAWFWFFCYDDPGCSCSAIPTEAVCEDALCGWEASGGECSGACACENLASETVCTQSGCLWDPSGPCEGTPTECTNFSNQSTCENQVGCVWAETGGGYPTDTPDVYPAQSLEVNNLISWSSFTETAVKNGGEIYYQLSDDSGASWKYWNGSTWQTTSGSDYNTASVVDYNISEFPVNKTEITFRAFLNSNGSQQIQLDGVEIGYTYTSEGGDYSQAVDLAIDDNDNIYVVWETYDGSDYDIYMQKVDTDGTILWTNDAQINNTDDGNQNNPNVEIDSSGNALVTWQDDRNGNDQDIYLQKVDSSGNLLWPSDVLASFYDGQNQKNPEIVIDQTDNIFVAWHDDRNGDNDIYLQKINTNGEVVWDSDIRVNAETTNDQSNADLTLNQSDNLVVCWQDNKSGDYDIIAVEYNGDPSSTSPLPYIPVTVTGAKKVGKDPVIYKYDKNHTTNANGSLILTNMEWDTYSITLQSGSGYTIFSADPPLPVLVNPADDITITLILE